MTKKEVVSRFFDGDVNLYDEIGLTENEITKLENFEWRVLIDNGLKNINGGYSIVTIYGGNEDELLCRVECGEQDTGAGGNSTYWRVRYDRKTEKFEEV